jgi:hypothetical protein
LRKTNVRQLGGGKTRFGKEDDMSPHLQASLVPASRAASTELHPVVHIAAAALLIWFVVAAWLLFGGSGDIELALAIVSVLAFMVLAIPLALWRANVTARRRNANSMVSDESHAAGKPESWASWLSGEFSTSTDREKSSEAVVEILLPIAAVAVGITVLGIVLNLASAGFV